MARDKVEDTDHPAADSEPTEAAGTPAKAKQTAPAKDKPDGGAAAGRGTSGTATAAARHRTVMQRRHVRIALAMTAAVGVEIAGAAGLVAASLLSWQWGEALWGQSEMVWVVLQAALALVLLALVAAWLVRSEQLRARLRVPLLVPAGAVAVVSLALLWQTEPAGRGPGPLVATVGAVLVLAGATTWLIGLRQLQALFPFGLGDARSRGFGNLPTVRRAQFVGGPAGAVGGAALVAGALLVTPGWVTTVDSSTADRLALGEHPSAETAGEPAWTVELAAAQEGRPTQVWGTPGGLIIEEESGVRAVDPRTGEDRWHWRDDTYQRVAGVVTGGGDTVVLALEYDGGGTGRDRVIALDTGTGELQWDRFDDELVAAMSNIVVAHETGDWFVVPDQPSSPAVEEESSLSLVAIDAESGEESWRVEEDEGCGFIAATGGTAGLLVSTQQCAPLPGDNGEAVEPAGSCLVTGTDPETAEARWSWPDAETVVADCQVAAAEEVVVVTYQADDGREGVALDPITGEVRWQIEDEAELDGIRNHVQIGEELIGTEWQDDGAGGGAGELIIRSAQDGEVRERVELPEGQPIEVAAAAPGTAAVAHYRPETAEVVLLTVDLAEAEISSEAVVTGSPGDGQFRQVTLSSGPAALALSTLVGIGTEVESATYHLHVYGW
ncbi:PQQ-binding-like beta-propeller repeat protein [Natronosporangium hydrolyticum]|uniref:PQQ-binding-like beta-propeller repeat protein n=1 Tax=Natronosporangium hydrolyticum TaxID=2811111 RepID=A0A895YKA0_9ACTN|nr:PQQ-binding-like beta-propeller repeat protein [Natronosporangium hydrolyticum]QSB16462.1 PQQ-binding-like beta-propeller repeat protein [Natronosporangium hydrolyticum]